MDYSMIGKIEKAKRYDQERGPFEFHSFKVTVKGDNNAHVVDYADGIWKCDCEYFQTRGRCVHTMSLETILDRMTIPVEVSVQA
jgi:hypothetical protein